MATGRRNGRIFIYIALILILLLVLAYIFTRNNNPLLGNSGSSTANNGASGTPTPTQVQDVVNIVMTTQDIKRGQILNEDILTLISIPRKDYTDGVFFQDMNDLVGARARFDLNAHTPLTRALVVENASQNNVASFEIPAGKVAISIPVSKLSSVAYGLQQGDHVNVIASLLLVDLDTEFQSRLPNRTGMVIAPGPIGVQNSTDSVETSLTARLRSGKDYTNTDDAFSYLGRIEIDPSLNNPVSLVPSEAQRPRLVSQTLIQDAIVLQMGVFDQGVMPAPTPVVVTNEQQTPEAQQPQQVQPTVAPTLPDVATLVVDPQDAVTINYLMLAGANLNLVLRSAGDPNQSTEAVTLQFIMDQYRIPNPAKLPYGLEPRMDSFPKQVPSYPEVRPEDQSAQ